MLEKQHKIIDPGFLKCCFSSSMKRMIHTTASRKRGGVISLGSGFLILLLAGCAPQGGSYDAAAPASPPGELHRSQIPWNKPVDPSAAAGPARRTAEAKPRKAAEERPGLATGFGASTPSPWFQQSFIRATPTKAAGTGAIYYNNREGIDAMTGYKRKVSGVQTAAGDMIEWGIKGGFGYLPTYDTYSSSRRFVVGKHGSNYSIVLKNRCKSRLEVVLSVDGLDVLDGKTASFPKRGYVIAPDETLEIKGWRTSPETVARFQFSTVAGSYANLAHGDHRNVGVIGMAVFTEKGVDPWTWMPQEVNDRLTANPFAKAP